MSLKALVASKDWESFLDYLKEQEEVLVKNSMNVSDPVDIYRYQGEYRLIKKLTRLKESLRNG